MVGRKPLPVDEKRRLVSLKLHPKIIQFLKDNKDLGSQAKIVETALKKQFKELR